MSLFVCTKCQNIENTALCYYWSGSRLCSNCDPLINEWHGRFKQTKFDPLHDKIVDGFIERN